jgi:hypothetical protein
MLEAKAKDLALRRLRSDLARYAPDVARLLRRQSSAKSSATGAASRVCSAFWSAVIKVDAERVLMVRQR